MEMLEFGISIQDSCKLNEAMVDGLVRRQLPLPRSIEAFPSFLIKSWDLVNISVSFGSQSCWHSENYSSLSIWQLLAERINSRSSLT